MTKTLVNPRLDSASSSAVAMPAPSVPERSRQNDRQTRMLEAMRTQYQLDQQVKFLHLQAEAESLLQQLRSLKQQRQSATYPIAADPHTN